MDFGQIVGLVVSGSVMTGFGAALNGWIKSKSDAKLAETRTSAELKLTESAQEFSQQSLIINDLRRRIEFLEKANADCISDRSKLHHEVGKLEGRLDEQNSSMQHLRTTNTEQSRDAVKLASEIAAKGVEVAAQLMSDSAVRLQQQNHPIQVDAKLTVTDIESIH